MLAGRSAVQILGECTLLDFSTKGSEIRSHVSHLVAFIRFHLASAASVVALPIGAAT